MRTARLAIALCAALIASPAQGQVSRFNRMVDGSGTIATANTSQAVFPGNRSDRAYLFCQNPIAATGPLFVNIDAAASTTAGSYELAPGGTLTLAGVVAIGTVNVASATVGARFICKQGVNQ